METQRFFKSQTCKRNSAALIFHENAVNFEWKTMRRSIFNDKQEMDAKTQNFEI